MKPNLYDNGFVVGTKTRKQNLPVMKTCVSTTNGHKKFSKDKLN